MTRTSINPGRVEWCGHSAIACLGDGMGDRCTTLVRIAEVVLSPFGSGTVCLLLCSPNLAKGSECEPNLLLSDNASLACWLFDGWFRKFPETRKLPSMDSVGYAELTGSSVGWTVPGSAGVFSFTSTSCRLELEFSQFGEPIPVELRADAGPTGLHEMYGVVIEAKNVSIVVDGERRDGLILNHGSGGERVGLAMMALSQTWVSLSPSGGRADAT